MKLFKKESKQKTAYEIRIRDWSSDVCSSDLLCPTFQAVNAGTLDSQPPCQFCLGNALLQTGLHKLGYDFLPFAQFLHTLTLSLIHICFRLLDIGKVAGGEADNDHIRHSVFGAAVGIDGRAAVGGVLDVGVFQKVVLFIHQRRFATDKEQSQIVVQHTDLIGRHQLPARDLVIGGVAAGMPGAFAVGVQPEGAFPQVVLGDQLVGGRFIAAQIQKFIAVADDGFPLLFKQRLELGNVLNDDGVFLSPYCCFLFVSLDEETVCHAA